MTKARTVTITLVLLDALSVVAAFNVVAWLHVPAVWQGMIVAPLALPVVIHFLAVYLIDGYSSRSDMLSVTYTSQHTIALAGVLALTLLLTFVFIPAGFELQSSRFVITFAYILLVPATLSYRRLFYRLLLLQQKQRYFMFLGSPESCQEFKDECRKNAMKQDVLFATHETFAPQTREPGGFSARPFGDVVDYLDEFSGQIDAVILRESSLELPPAVAQKLVELHFSGVPTYTLELFHQVYWRKIPLYRINQTWLFQEGFQIAREPVFERLKRLSDIVLAGLGLLLGALLYPLLAAAIWLEDRGPVLFRQSRVGRNRVNFEVIKFRTMRAGAGGDRYTRSNDSRITRVGRFLRASRLDEVPQLWNVLVGDMSLIGPRAEWTKLVADYEKQIPCYHFRHLVKPGITGWAQINYPYGEDLEDTLRKLEYDLYYIRYFSFILDASIVLKTVHVMLFGKGR
ncbi:MAG: exopolysaccharide biosynthesis polyprenyl glycosylphosphotransferase [Opitutae bacterium]|nr:exopolysaccharide biosynthesis polyprenyl glycosylphosphotransferase [Opitutae bacterium]